MLTSGTVAKSDEQDTPEITESTPADEQPESLLDELADDLNPIADLDETLTKVQSRYIIAMLLSFLAATVVGMVSVLTNPVRDWPLFGGMFLVVLSYMVLYIKAHQRRRKILRTISMAMSEALIVFWVAILVDRIPARKVLIDGVVVQREAMPLLWLSVILVGLSGLIMFFHWAYLGRKVEQALDSGAGEADSTASGHTENG